MTQHPSLTDQVGNWCRHYRGIHQHKTCKLGVRYDVVRDSDAQPYRWPCFKDDNCAERCSEASYPTPDEIAAKVQDISEVVTTFLTEMAQGVCPHCHTKVESREQHGMCIYNLPCGCRLGTGTTEE